MCCFSVEVQNVADTKIFARLTTVGLQYLVYSMTIATNEQGAMVLPLPVVRNCTEDAVRFINLEQYESFFDDLDYCFPVSRSRAVAVAAAPQAASTLKVVSVGSFDASFVPTLQDFQRLDARFRLPELVWDAMPDYQDYGFAVFKLKPGAMSVHPMAFAFPTRNQQALFFPTVHVHDGKVHWLAKFDHNLYCQKTEIEGRMLSHWDQTFMPLGERLDAEKAQGIIDPESNGYRLKLRGRHQNKDIWLS